MVLIGIISGIDFLSNVPYTLCLLGRIFLFFNHFKLNCRRPLCVYWLYMRPLILLSGVVFRGYRFSGRVKSILAFIACWLLVLLLITIKVHVLHLSKWHTFHVASQLIQWSSILLICGDGGRSVEFLLRPVHLPVIWLIATISKRSILCWSFILVFRLFNRGGGCLFTIFGYHLL